MGVLGGGKRREGWCDIDPKRVIFPAFPHNSNKLAEVLQIKTPKFKKNQPNTTRYRH